ncbi:MAG TPA: carboxypeptidase-like regulatory domain-containing protein [Bacteroidales bacterium]|nr:carboxypeptidase-like regulatory domain-containing protein [Bacteroidales bacterium]
MFRLLISAIFFILFLTGCTETIPDLEGSMVGYIRSLDEFARFNNDEEGFRVTTRGAAYYTTETDKAGRFEFRDLPAGTYELSIYKPGYGMMKEYSVQHLGGAPTILHLSASEVSKYNLYRIPETRILDFSISISKITVNFSFLSYMPEDMRVQVCFSDIMDFSEEEIKKTVNYTVRRNGDAYTATFYPGSFPFYQGQKIYMKARIFSWFSGGVSIYYDPLMGRNVYPNLGVESDEYSFIFEQ